MKKQLDLQYPPFVMTPWLKTMRITAISPFNRKIIAAAAIIGVVAGMSDIFMDMAAWFFHSLIELLYALFEMFEISLDYSIEHLFHTGLHVTQIIVFYVMLCLALWGGYKLWYGLPRWFERATTNFENFWLDQKYAAVYDWENQSWLDKIGSIIFVALCCAAVYLLYF